MVPLGFDLHRSGVNVEATSAGTAPHEAPGERP